MALWWVWLAVRQEKRVVKKVPRGTSEYQAAWIVETDSEEVRCLSLCPCPVLFPCSFLCISEDDDGSDMEEEEGLASEGVWSDSEGALSSEEELEELCTDTNTDMVSSECEPRTLM